MNLVFLVNQLEQHTNTNVWREKRKAFVFSGSSLQINESNSVIVLPDSVFNKTIIPIALVGCEMIIANSFPMRARGIIIIQQLLLINHVY